MSTALSISAFPRQSLRAAVARPGPFAADLAGCAGHYLKGRDAIYWAFLGLAQPLHPAWFPSFHCGVEVQAALEAGFEPSFYHVGPDLSLDLEDLARKLRQRPGPVLVIHYHGFPQPQIEALARLCQEHGVALIEDCAHALFSLRGDKPLGSFAPLSVYSLTKTLPVIDGGLLQANRAQLQRWTGRSLIQPPTGKRSLEPYQLLIKDQLRELLGAPVTQAYRRLRFGPNETAALEERSALTPGRDPGRAMSWLSRRVAAAIDPEAVRQKRRANFSLLLELLDGRPGFSPLEGSLPVGVCPLFLPIWVTRRQQLAAALATRGVETFVFGALPHPLLPEADFPEARRLRQQILCLPVHQELSASQLEQLAARLAPLLLDHTSD